MAQFLFKGIVNTNTSVNSDFHFNGDEPLGGSNDYKNVIRISRDQLLLDEDFSQIYDSVTDLTTLFEVNDYLHVIAKAQTVGQDVKIQSNAFESGTKIVAVKKPEGNETQIDIILSKGVSEDMEADDQYFFVFEKFINKTEKGVISLDASKLQKIKTEVPLFDAVSFSKLFDDFGNELTTNVEIALIDKINSANALATRVNNTKPLRVVEEFKSDSAVSVSLLGVPRAETQLSLFSDVSTLGFDDNSWEAFKSVERRITAYEPWETRKTIDSQRFNAKITENIIEQALELSAFPVPYTYPWDAADEDGRFYKKDEFELFKRFILLGNFLFNIYEGESFQHDFLDPNQVTIDDVEIAGLEDDTVSIAPRLQYEDEDSAYRLIDIWTETFIKIDLGIYPNLTKGRIVDLVYSNKSPFDGQRRAAEATLSEYTSISNQYKAGNTTAGDLAKGLKAFYKPGYDWPEDSEESIILRTKETYRYQPGRISGFTFGTRSDVIASSGGTLAEWGVENETDAYVIRLVGSNLSIVRRSTIPLTDAFLDDNALTGKQVYISDKKDQFTEAPLPAYYELEIPRAQWNGDPLDGNGPSGYQLTPQQVTMWKIEFSWYGAIGAKFYAYIPVGNNIARWVLVHTIVIENKLFKACLEDPFFRMKYQFTLRNRQDSSRKQFIYKYGSSVYIDGGDEGTKKQYSYNGDNKDVIPDTYTPLIGLKAKNMIKNRDGVEIKNRKIAYPELLNINTDDFTQFDIVECEACPGFGFTYDNGLKAEEPQDVDNRKEINFHVTEISKEGELEDTINTQYLKLSDNIFLHGDSPETEIVGFTPFDDDAQILLPGFGRRFIDYKSTLEDFTVADEDDKDQFLFDDNDLRDPTGLVNGNLGPFNLVPGETISRNIDDSVLNSFDIPVGAVIQVEAQLIRTGGVDDTIAVVLESANEETSEEVNPDVDSPAPSSETYQFRLIATKKGTSKITFKGGTANTLTTVQITGIRIAEFKISRVKQKVINVVNEDSLDEVETPTEHTERFFRGASKLKIGTIGINGEIQIADIPGLEDRIQTILDKEDIDWSSPWSVDTFQDKAPFDVKDRRLTIDRKYFDGDYGDDSPGDEPYKEYTWFIGNKCILSPINKVYAVPNNISVINEDTEMRFLNPVKRVSKNKSDIYTGMPAGEFRIAFTNKDPSDNITPKEKDLLFVDYGKTRISANFSAENIDGASDHNYLFNSIETFQLDYRIKRVPNDYKGGLIDNGGFCSSIKVSAADREDFGGLYFFDNREDPAFTGKYNDANNEELTINSQFSDYPTANILVVEDTELQSTIFDENGKGIVTFTDGELGINNLGTSTYFVEEPLLFKYNDNEGIQHTAIAFALDGDVTLSSNSPDEDVFTLSFVKLAYTYNGTGATVREKKKLFGFDPFPLYPIVFTRYGAQLNNINFKQGNVVNTPEWTLYDGDNIEVFNQLQSNEPGYIPIDDASAKNPDNFEEQDRLSALLVDKSSNKRLRKIFTPGENIFRKVYDNGGYAKYVGNTSSSSRVRLISSFYAGGDDAPLSIEKFNLNSIFKEDRNKIQQDFRDSKAIYFIGKQPLSSPSGIFRASINTSEI